VCRASCGQEVDAECVEKVRILKEVQEVARDDCETDIQMKLSKVKAIMSHHESS